jgi:hypothetical protein
MLRQQLNLTPGPGVHKLYWNISRVPNWASFQPTWKLIQPKEHKGLKDFNREKRKPHERFFNRQGARNAGFLTADFADFADFISDF